MYAVALLASIAVTTSGPAAQIPERAQWEITFAQVETAADLPDLRSSPPLSAEIRIMERAGTAFGPVPFLRLVRTDTGVRPQLFVFWRTRGIAPGREPQGPDVRCRDGVCVKPIDIEGEPDWEKLVNDLAGGTACPSTRSGEVVMVCPHCPTLWIKTVVGGTYREASCVEPARVTTAGALLYLMRASARAAR